MELTVDSEKVLDLARECPQWKEGLKILFPEAFKEKGWKDIPLDEVFKWSEHDIELTINPTDRCDIGFFPVGSREGLRIYLSFEDRRPSSWVNLLMGRKAAGAMAKAIFDYLEEDYE